MVLAAKKYPAGSDRGSTITGVEEAEAEGVLVFHAGTALHGDRLVTNGGRILSVTGVGETVAEARASAYRGADLIAFDGARRRDDIALAAAEGETSRCTPHDPKFPWGHPAPPPTSSLTRKCARVGNGRSMPRLRRWTSGSERPGRTRIAPVIPRYSRPAMARIWSEEAKLEGWLAVELAALDAWEQVGTLPPGTARDIRARATAPTPERVAELERTTNHDVAAFVDAVASELGPAGRWFHYGLTSSDVLDTALALTVRDAGGLVLGGIDRALSAVVERAEEHRDTLTIGRTHGVHAEPMTFGLKLAGWAFQLDARPAARRERPRGHARREAERRGRNVLGNAARGGATCVREPRARAGSELDADPPAGPPRGASVGARAARLVAGALRARDPAPGAHRGA